MRPVMTITIHIGYTEGSLSRELSLPGGPEVGTSTPRQRKAAVYTGLFPYTQPEDRDGLSV
jgi:hypothetical protein